MMANRSSTPLPVDRGWAWVILLATFVEISFCSTMFLSGMYNLIFLEAFHYSVTFTSWCSALHSSLFSIVGPFTSLLIKSVGARITAMIGASLIVLGYLVSSLISNFTVIFIFFGIGAGCGFGFLYLPFLVWLGFHFKKYRNIAFGIASTAGGIGPLIFAPFLQYLIEKYGWQGGMMVMAGMCSHLFAAALLLRPIDFETDDDQSAQDTLDINDKCVHVHTSDKLDGHNNLKNRETKELLQNHPKCFLKKTISGNKNVNRELHSSRSRSQNTALGHTLSENGCVPDNQVTLSQPNIYDYSSKKMPVFYFSQHDLQRDQHHDIDKTLANINHHHVSSNAITSSMISLKNPWTKSKNCEVVSENSKTLVSFDDLKIESKNGKAEKDKSKTWNTIKQEYEVLRNKKFIFFCINLLFLNLGLAIGYIYLPALALANGSTPFQAANLLSVVGISNIFSRLLAGIATNGDGLDIYAVYMGACGLNGLCLLMTHFLSSSYPGQLMIALCFGLYGNVFNSLVCPITIDLVGIQCLNVANGIELLLSGIGLLLGPPAAGLVFDCSGSYENTMFMAGFCYFIASLAMMFIPVVDGSPET